MDRQNSQIPGQTGYLTLNLDGAVLASSGELNNDERVAALLHTLIGYKDRLDSSSFNQSFKRITIQYDDHAYIVCISNRRIHIIKRQTDPK